LVRVSWYCFMRRSIVALSSVRCGAVTLPFTETRVKTQTNRAKERQNRGFK
jgi:hypothetical protein